MSEKYLNDGELNKAYLNVLRAMDNLEKAKSPDRTAKDRLIAIAITDGEKMLAWLRYVDTFTIPE